MTTFDWWVLGLVLLGNGVIWVGAVRLLYRRSDGRHDVSALLLSKHCDPEHDEYTAVFQVEREQLSLQTSPEMYAGLRPDSRGVLTYAGEAMVSFRPASGI